MRSFIEPDLFDNNVPFDNITPFYLINMRWKLCSFIRNTVTCVFEPPFSDLRGTYAVHLRLIGKLMSDFLLEIIELLSLGVTTEALRANIDWKSVFLKVWVNLAQTFR